MFVYVAFSLVEAFGVTSGQLLWAEFHAENMNPHKLVELSGLPVCFNQTYIHSR